MTVKLHPSKIEFSEAKRAKLVEFLNQRVADTSDLYSQLKQAHWNVKGPAFIAVHELFDKIAEDVNDFTDLIAERAVMMGGQVHGTVRAAAKASTLKEYPLDAVDQHAHIAAVSDRLAAYGKIAREAIDTLAKEGDADSADVFTEISRAIDKYRWFVEAHNEGKA